MIGRLIHILPTAEECATEVAGAGSVWQVQFLNALAKHGFWREQLEAVRNDPGLSAEALEMIGV